MEQVIKGIFVVFILVPAIVWAVRELRRMQHMR